MLIKVHSTGDMDSWRYYDNAREVQFITGLLEELDTGAVSLDVIEERFINEGNVSPNVTLITFLDGQDTPRHIYTNTQAYLMTDAGKTIERIS